MKIVYLTAQWLGPFQLAQHSRPEACGRSQKKTDSEAQRYPSSNHTPDSISESSGMANYGTLTSSEERRDPVLLGIAIVYVKMNCAEIICCTPTCRYCQQGPSDMSSVALRY
jgi:hypothetical protein